MYFHVKANMTIQEFSSLITILAIVATGAWAVFRFGISREYYPKLQFEINLNQLGKNQDKNIVELVATITNKGITRQYIRDFIFHIMVLDDDTKMDIGDPEIEHQLKFDVKAKGISWIHSGFDPFVDGSTSHQFTHVTALDQKTRFVMIYSKFNYRTRRTLFRRSDKYYISKTFALK